MKVGPTVTERSSSADADKIDGITLIIPAYNEAGGIVSTLGDISKISDQVSYSVEVVVVDDGSTDTIILTVAVSTHCNHDGSIDTTSYEIYFDV